MPSLSTAQTAALSYALLVLLVCLMMLIGTISQPDVSWRRVVGHTSIAVIAPLPPLITLWLGRKLARNESAERTLASGVILSVAVPFILGLFVLLSSEPLAMLFMLYTPAVQLVIGLVTLVMAWGVGRSRQG
jgi:hypothetical protein